MTGQGSHTDIIQASALAYVNALNKLEYRRAVQDEAAGGGRPMSTHDHDREDPRPRTPAETPSQPGDNVWVDVDVLMTHDVCGPGTIGIFKQHFGKDAKVWDRDKVVIIPDHYIFTADAMANRNVDVLRAVRGGAGPAVLLRRRHATLQGRLPHRPAGGRPHPARRGAASAPTATPAPPGRSASSPPASATPTPASSWAPASSGSRCRRRCGSSSTASCRRT